MPGKLKVYRTPIGFHDAYVAAPSQKAALEAWGSDANLFARGMAELVTDPALTGEPLAKPGEVIRRARGTAAEHVAALPRGRKPKGKVRETARPPRPMPGRESVAAAEQALEAAEARQRREEAELSSREKALAQERRKLEAAHRGEVAQLQRALNRATDEYRSALDAWEP